MREVAGSYGSVVVKCCFDVVLVGVALADGRGIRFCRFSLVLGADQVSRTWSVGGQNIILL